MKWRPRLFSRARYERELDEELQHHLAARAADLEAEGLSPDDARRQAEREFGSVEAVKDYTRDRDGWSVLDEARRNVAFAWRRWRRRPATFGAILVTLAVCIAANAIVFGAVDAVLLRALPYPEPEQLHRVAWSVGADQTATRDSVNGAMWFALEEAASTDAALAVYTGWISDVNFVRTGPGGEVSASLLRQQRVGAGFFDVFGVPLARGRDFEAEEDLPGGPAVTVLSWDLWQRELGGRDDVLGTAVSLGGRPHTVIGVAAPGFEARFSTDLWVPLRPSRSGEGSGTNYQVAARVGSDGPIERVQAALRAAAEQTELRSETEGFRYLLEPMQETETALLRPTLFILWAVAALVLLLGCVNVAGLLLAQATEREAELATRRALGGGFSAVVRQLLTESAVLGFGGAALGVGLSWFGLRWFGEVGRQMVGLWQPLGLDGRLALAMVGFAILATALFGLLPAVHLARNGVGALRTRGVTRTSRLRGAMVVVQVAIGVALLLVAGLLLRTFLHLGGQDAGVDDEGLLAASVSLRDERFQDTASIANYFEEGRRRLEARPEIASAGVALSLPYQRGLNMPTFLDGAEEPSLAVVNYVLPGTLDVFGVRRIAGRLLDERDGAEAPTVAVVSEQFVAEYLGEGVGSAVGQRFSMSDIEWEIVGVVGDIRQRPSFGGFSAPLANEVPTIYVPQAQLGDGFFGLVHTWFPPHWVVRTQGAEGPARAAVREVLRAVDPLTPIASLRDLGEERRAALSNQRILGGLVTVLALVALLLATVGVAGISASAVAERKKSLGIRLALGSARSGAVLRAAVPGLALVGVGIVVGMILAQIGRTGLRSMLHGVGFLDPVATFGAVAAMVLVAGVAGLIPALRIASLSLVETLQDE